VDDDDERSWEESDEASTKAVTICGTDLHILKGDVPR